MSILRLSLGQSQASKVAKLLSNDTASRIMDALSVDSKSETELSKELDIPLSTVHYNVQKLTDAGILTSDEFTYSEKGKEVRHYRLASEHILITTKPSAPLPELFTGGALAVLVAAGIAIFTRTQQVVPESRMMADSATESTMMMAQSAPQAASNPAIWPWVLLGAAVVLLGVAITIAVRRYKE